MGEEASQGAPPEAPQPETPKSRVYELLQSLRGGKTDPLMALLLLSELRRMERDEERWSYEREHLLRQTQNPSKEVDIEKLLEKVTQSWETRFQQYQSNLEKLLLGRKAEEAEEKALRLEKELKETKEKIELEKLLKDKVEEALVPYKEQISQLQNILASKTAGMTENEKKGFFQSLGEQIESSLSQEVSDTIAKNVASAITKAFAPKEEEVPVTPEGKVDTYKMVDRWVKRGLDTLKTVVERWPKGKPQMQQVRKLPTAQETPPTPTAPPQPPPQPIIEVPKEAEQKPAEEKIEKQPPAVEEEKPPQEGEKVEQKTEETEAGQSKPSQEATGEGAKSQES